MNDTKSIVREALIKASPIMVTYFVLGLGFGFLLEKNGFGAGWALAMSLIIYSGTMQYAGVALMAAGTSLISTLAVSMLIQVRHLFYSISMIKRYRDSGKKKWYLLYALTDETYSIVCEDKFDGADRWKRKSLFLSMFDQCAWVTGTVVGGLLGAAVAFDATGMEFSMTALFTTIYIQQWIDSQNHVAAVTGLAATALSRVLLGEDLFLLAAMAIILIVLTVMRKSIEKDLNAGRPSPAIEGTDIAEGGGSREQF